jgi:hypothetical protein
MALVAMLAKLLTSMHRRHTDDRIRSGLAEYEAMLAMINSPDELETEKDFRKVMEDASRQLKHGLEKTKGPTDVTGSVRHKRTRDEAKRKKRYMPVSCF